ncbi:MAG: DUF1007 family protein [Spirochaetia bacterium]|nr:DUF1007 family protein [Spirochaetia bacterium]
MFFCLTASLFSHPHTFIDSVVECEFNESGISGFWINWSFDPMFATSIIMDFDRDKNGVFSKSEIKDIRENAFSNLENFNYFIYITENRKTRRPITVTNFSASIVEDDIIYRFFVPYNSSAADKQNSVIIAIYDETFFCDISIKSVKTVPDDISDIFTIEKKIRINEEKTIKYDNAFQSITRDGASYTGFVNPQEIVIRFSKK